MNEHLINFTEAQKHLGVSRSTLLRWLKDKRITGYKAGKKWKFYPEDLNQILLKERPSVYTTDDSKEFLKLLNPFLPKKFKCKDIYSWDFWCEWQDITQWSRITVHINRNIALIEAIQNQPGKSTTHFKIPVSTAKKIIGIWRTWDIKSEITPPRPGKYSFISGTDGYKISTLQLPANFKNFLETYKFSKKIENKIAAAKQCDVYIYGPPERKTAFAAYSILSKLISRNTTPDVSVFTSEKEPTYFIPDALQVYDDNPVFFPATKFSLIQIEEFDLMPSRGISPPPFRIAYSYGKQNNKLKESKNVIIIKAK
jgi:excisionase family DNA binding protein